MIEFDDYSRCGMPNQSSNYYTYDPSGYITDHVYHFESNMHDRYTHDTYSYALGNSIHIQAAPSDNSPKCKGTSFQPGFILSGGCGYVSIHWTPSTGLSSDTVLSPVISFQDSITYTISFTDSNGNTGSYIYTLVPYTAHIVIDNTCNGNTWATLYGETTLDYYTTFSWYLDTTFQSTSYYSYNVNQAGNYFAKVTDYNSGCVVYSDTVTINNPTIASIVHADICSGDQYFLPDGQPVNTTGVYNTTYTSVSGCDSTIVSDVNVIPVLTDSVSDNISVNQQYTLPDGQIVSQPGTYNCTITASTGCDSIVVVTLHGVLATSVNSIQSEQLFTLSPVPVQNDLFIHTKLSGNFDIRINDMLGNVVMMNLSSHADDRISMSTLPAGFYIITVIQEGHPLYRSTIEKF
jgi:hypothetical protein